MSEPSTTLTSNPKFLAEKLRLRAISLQASDPLVDDLLAAYDILIRIRNDEGWLSTPNPFLTRIAVANGVQVPGGTWGVYCNEHGATLHVTCCPRCLAGH